MCNPAPISQNGHKVWEKAAAGKNPKPGEIQHPVRGSGRVEVRDSESISPASKQQGDPPPVLST